VSITRRKFLQQSSLSAAALLMPQGSHRTGQILRPVLDPDSLAPFVDPLPIPAVAHPGADRPSPADPSVKIPYYRLAMLALEAKVHRDVKPTRFWAIGSSFPGPTLETRTGQGIFVEWANELPTMHPLPIDHTLYGAGPDKPDVRTVIHLHGAKVPPESDGNPENWFIPGKSATYFYPNNQDAALLWYHDHTLGISRLNLFAGLMGLCIVRDPVEDALNLPKGAYEIPLLLCDRLFDLDGQLYYPVSAHPKTPWVPEFFGNMILINGKILPYLDVEPRKYRFRILNAANGRSFHLTFGNGQGFHQIGADQGLMPAPIALNRLSLAPAERADLIFDFAGQPGEQIVVKNDYNVPVMQIRVSRQKVADPSTMPATLRPVPKLTESAATRTRTLALGELDDPFQYPLAMLLNNARWNAPVTENPALNSTEIWELVNLTDQAHPIHLHLVRFQILDRRPFDAYAYQSHNSVRYRGAPVAPDPAETGWKDTVRADPGTITRIIVPFEGYPGRYLWHCHILEHQDNEMMRPFDVLAK